MLVLWLLEVVAEQNGTVILDHYAAGLALLRIGTSWGLSKDDFCLNPSLAVLKYVLSHGQFLFWALAGTLLAQAIFVNDGVELVPPDLSLGVWSI